MRAASKDWKGGAAPRSAVPLAVAVALALGLAACRPGAPVGEAPSGEASVAYVGDAACASCHGDVSAAYARTPKAHAVSRFAADTAPERFGPGGNSPAVYDPNLDFYYQAFLRGGALHQREFRLGPAGDTLHLRVHRADYVIGSGSATRSYLMHAGGYLTQMPLTWYAEREIWALSPGYDVRNDRFGRPTNLECITCHNGLPEHSAFTQNHFPSLPEGITCERCHGPGAAHAEAFADGAPPAGRSVPGLVNPAALSRDLQLAACGQCHLEGYTVFAAGEGPTTYRPGQPLEAHRRVFLPEEQVRDPVRFGVASHAVRLAESACFQQSALTCTTCHDPHRPPAELGPDPFNRACQSCHGGEAHVALCAREPGLSPEAAASGNCVSCHMPAGAPSDIPHVSFTDHWIRRRPPAAADPGPIEVVLTRERPLALVDVLAEQRLAAPRPAAEAELDRALALFAFFETKHPHPGYLPEVAAAVRRGLRGGADRPEARIALGRALALMDSLPAAERTLAEVARRHPEHALAQYWLGSLRLRMGDAEGSLGPLARAVEVQPLLIEARVRLAEALAARGRRDEAAAHLEAAVAANPLHHPEAWNNLGLLRLEDGDAARAVPALERAVALDPDLARARTNLGAALLLAERPADAVRHLEAAVRLSPDDPAPHGNLGVAYLALGRPQEARRPLERVLALSPGDARARALLAQIARGG